MPIQFWTATYDPAGNRVGIADLEGNLSTFTMDAKDRLSQDATTGPNAHEYQYSYDPVGNRLTANESGVLTSYSYNPAQQLTAAVAGTAVTTYSYCPNGNLTVVQGPTGTTTMTYYKENKMASDQSATSAATFTYAEGGLGRMRSQNVNGALSTFVWDGNGLLGTRS